MPDWQPVDVFPESALAWEVAATSWDEGELFLSVLRIRFAGVYRPGSSGSPDASLMMAVTGAALARDWPDVVLFDLGALDYKLGDGLLGIFEVVAARDAERPVASVLVAGPDAIGAVRGLLGGGAGVVFETEEAAWPRVVELAIGRARSIG